MDKFVELCILQFYAQNEKENLEGNFRTVAIYSIREFKEKLLKEILRYSKDTDTFLRLKEQFESAMIQPKDFQDELKLRIQLIQQLTSTDLEQS